MSIRTRQLDVFMQGASPKETYEFVTMGTVVDTNDPQQEGRVRVVCPTLGETMQTPITDVPWALYSSPLAGHTEVGTRGPGIQKSTGAISYGIWARPKVGAQVLVMFVDGNPNFRVCIGAIHDHLRSHTMPHGRWMYDDHPELEKSGADPRAFGPYTSFEKFIEPLHTNIKQAFGNVSEPNYEWRSRAADYTVSAIDVDSLSLVEGKVADDKDVAWDDWVSRQGYQMNRQDPFAPSSFSEGNIDNMITAIVSPGFHAISMDDRQENCRMRFRTTAGHQLIIDDTNERIYIATAKGNNWIEMDQNGNIDIFTTNKVNVRAKKTINFTSDDTIRFQAEKGIHMITNGEIRMQAAQDVHMRFSQNLRINVSQSTFVLSGQDINAKAGSNMFLEATQDINAKAGSNMFLEATQDINVLAQDGELKLTSGQMMHLFTTDQILQTADQIHFNGPVATLASSSSPTSPPNEQPSFWTSRKPDHEPFARCSTKNDFTHEPEFSYTDSQVNRQERGVVYERGKYWRR